MAGADGTRDGAGRRGEEYLRLVASAGRGRTIYDDAAERGIEMVYFELAKLELERRGLASPPIDGGNLDRSLSYVGSGRDCADFALPAFLRIMYLHRGSATLPPGTLERIEAVILAYKYWMDEPGEREHSCNYFTENHQILQHCCELLAGQLYPDGKFQNGRSGREHERHAIEFIDRWLGWRARFGFSEWLSNCYYEEDLLALVMIAEFADREDLASRARMVADLLLFDIAVNSFKGAFACSSGRTYLRMIVDPGLDGVSAISALLWGRGSAERALNKAALMMAAGGFEAPAALAAIAADEPLEMESRQRQSFDVEEGDGLGVPPAAFENIMLYWGMQEYDHSLVIDSSLKAVAPWDGIGDRIYAFKEKLEEGRALGASVNEDPDFTAMTRAETYAYRTRNYMLSCVQDFRRGKPGFQQHVWQASLGGRAAVFTTHPGSLEYEDRPNYWAGNGILPQAVAHKNVLVCMYRMDPAMTKLWQTHAYFPRGEFDELAERALWLFGRVGGGYLALRSMNGGAWKAPDLEMYRRLYRNDAAFDPSGIRPYDYSARGHANVWVCELGEERTHGSFADFVDSISAAELSGDVRGFSYRSPSLGLVETGWGRGLRVEGKEIRIRDYPRYENPYCVAPFDSSSFDIRCAGRRLRLDFSTLDRSE
jgi:hypothetical protein